MHIRLYTLVIIFFAPYLYSSDFGTTGIIDLPSAWMMNDGVLTSSISRQKVADIYNITYQATPWLQTTFRYTIFNPDNPERNSLKIDGLNDRSYSFKATLLKERNLTPEIAIGVKDALGTGAWASEYIVASKKVNNFNISLGMGWGRLAERSTFKNPLINFSDSFKIRGTFSPDVGGRQGGKTREKSFFKGQNVGVFGGIDYRIPNSDLSFLVEYNTDSYEREILKGTIDDSSPINYGFKWRGLKNIDLGLSYQQGNQLALYFSSKVNTKYLPIKKNDPISNSSYDEDMERMKLKNLNNNSWYDRLYNDYDESGLLLRKAHLNQESGEIWIEFSNYRYSLSADAVNKALVLAHIHLPVGINKINLIINEDGFRSIGVSYDKKQSVNKFSRMNKEMLTRIIPAQKISNPTTYTILPVPDAKIRSNLNMKVQLFDPDAPIRKQLFLRVDAVARISRNWRIIGDYALNISNDFEIGRDPASSLEHVRTDINEYLYYGSSGVESLYLENKSSLNSNIHYRLYLGILEYMYSGIGAEVLFQPFMSRVAFGGSINSVRRRGYERNFQLLDYKTITGFVSMFYASPFYNYDFAIHIGRYLAKDKGATIEVRRTFDNGFSVGAFATFTDVPEEVFGEGSFDKGLYFRVPFDFFSKNNTKSGIATVIRSVQRDGGQKLDDYSGRLWHDLRNVRYDNLTNNRSRISVK